MAINPNTGLEDPNWAGGAGGTNNSINAWGGGGGAGMYTVAKYNQY